VTNGGLGNQLLQLAIALYLEDQKKGGGTFIILNGNSLQDAFMDGKVFTHGRATSKSWPRKERYWPPAVPKRLEGYSGASSIDTLFGKFRQRLGLPVSTWINFDFRNDVFDAALASGGQWINYSVQSDGCQTLSGFVDCED